MPAATTSAIQQVQTKTASMEDEMDQHFYDGDDVEDDFSPQQGRMKRAKGNTGSKSAQMCYNSKHIRVMAAKQKTKSK
ncbi:hypothetical protein HDU98_000523 [Podochytrium sp. JEL0797]|nr:hypothetical protein HDU98_000523 [Podochytrium sp. JEL0797]